MFEQQEEICFSHKLDYAHLMVVHQWENDTDLENDMLFRVTLENPAGDLGVELDWSDGKTLKINSDAADGSIIDVWNKQNKENDKAKVTPGCRILEVNEIGSGSAALLLGQIKRSPELRLLLQKPDPEKNGIDNVVTKTEPKGFCSGRICNVVSTNLQRLSQMFSEFKDQVREFGYILFSAARTSISWGVPLVAVLFSFGVVSLSSRVATVYYVRYMRRLEQIQLGSYKHWPDDPAKWKGDALDPEWLDSRHYDYPQKLQDIFASWWKEPLVLPPWTWDLIGVLMPFMCFCVIITNRNVYMWTKTSVCLVCLNLGKAVCSVATVIPDAQGWQSCKNRLTDNGAFPDELKEVTTASFIWNGEMGEFQESLRSLTYMEMTGTHYCADMLYSSLTFVSLLYGMGFVETISDTKWGQNEANRWTLWIIALLVILVVIATSVASLAARYHYTIDVFLASVLTLLIYNYSPLLSACQRWAELAKQPDSHAMTGYAKFSTVTPTQSKAGFLGHARIVSQCCSFILGFFSNIYVTYKFYRSGDYICAATYMFCFFTIGILFTIFCFLDDSLKGSSFRCPLGFLLGTTHMLFIVQKIRLHLYGTGQDDFFKLQVLRAGIMGAPLATIQLHNLIQKPTAWSADMVIGYFNAMFSLSAIADAVASTDSSSTSVLNEIASNPLWQGMLTIMRMCEVSSRILLFVLLMAISEIAGHGYMRYTVGIIVVVDLLISMFLAWHLGAAKKPLAVFSFATASLATNINLFQKDRDQMKVADILCSIRMVEFIVIGGGVAYYFKRTHDANASLVLTAASKHPLMISAFVGSLVLYIMLLLPWLGIRQHLRPREYDDQDVD